MSSRARSDACSIGLLRGTPLRSAIENTLHGSTVGCRSVDTGGFELLRGCRRGAHHGEGGAPLIWRIRSSRAERFREVVLAGRAAGAGGTLRSDEPDCGVGGLSLRSAGDSWGRAFAMGSDVGVLFSCRRIIGGVFVPRVRAVHAGKRNWLLACGCLSLDTLCSSAFRKRQCRRELGGSAGYTRDWTLLVSNPAANREFVVRRGNACELRFWRNVPLFRAKQRRHL